MRYRRRSLTSAFDPLRTFTTEAYHGRMRKLLKHKPAPEKPE